MHSWKEPERSNALCDKLEIFLKILVSANKISIRKRIEWMSLWDRMMPNLFLERRTPFIEDDCLIHHNVQKLFKC